MNQGTIIMAVIVAAVAAWGTWQKQKRAEADLQTKAVRASLTMAEVELQNAEAINRGALKAAEIAAADAAAQAKIAADTRAKERLAWMRVNQLKKDIANVTENPPVPDAVELVLDRLRGVVPGPSGSPADHVDENGSAGTPDIGTDRVPASTNPTAEASVGSEHTQ